MSRIFIGKDKDELWAGANWRGKKSFEEYYKRYRCAVCFKTFKHGDEFELRAIQTPDETGSLTVQAVTVHCNCISRVDDNI